MRSFSLEKYRGSGTRHSCPACGAKKRFTRYIDTETGRYIADNVGRCDRESNCGYHFKPREYFAGIGDRENLIKPKIRRSQKPGMHRQGRKREDVSPGIYDARKRTTEARKPDFIERRHLIGSLGGYERNSFVQFLLNLFPLDHEAVFEAVKKYLIGTGRNGEATFWQIDEKHRIRTGKLIAYDPGTGKRRKDRKPNWIHAELKKAGQLPDAFELQQCLFGEHLLAKYPGRPVAIVEAEKTAVIASICEGVFPDLVWLACGGLSNLKAESLARIANGRKVILYPDANGYDKWQGIASRIRNDGFSIQVSDLIEKRATETEKLDGADLADYLISEQRRRNAPANRAAFQDLIEERLAIMTIDGGMSEAEAEDEIIASGFYQDAIHNVLGSRQPRDVVHPCADALNHAGGRTHHKNLTKTKISPE